jgi:methionine biosynthesis protein MetW
MDPALGQLDDERLAALLMGTPLQSPARSPGDHTDWQDHIIEDRVPAGASVLDLGCGNGELLSSLMARKHVRGQGIELSPEAVFECVARGVPVFQSDLDAGLKGFADHSFEYVVLEETLQTLHRPVDLLHEMLRVGQRSIVSFPNFAHWQIRFDLAVRGRMPVTPRLPRPWYDTPNIHLLTLQDFLDWAEANHVRIVEGHVLADGQVRSLQPGDNIHAEEVLIVLENSGK